MDFYHATLSVNHVLPLRFSKSLAYTTQPLIVEMTLSDVSYSNNKVIELALIERYYLTFGFFGEVLLGEVLLGEVLFDEVLLGEVCSCVPTRKAQH